MLHGTRQHVPQATPGRPRVDEDDPQAPASGFRAFERNISRPGARAWLNTVLFDLDSPLGRRANLLGMALIVLSVVLSMAATLETMPAKYSQAIRILETAVTLAFAAEYLLRLYAARWPLSYAFGFYGIVDLLTWLPLLVLGNPYVAIRLLRIVRLLKLLRYLRALRPLFSSMVDAVDIVLVVLATICILVLVAGNAAHLLEPETFDNAFLGCYWALVTMTTVGYGDVIPATVAGKLLASALMLIGITTFALLTGTISVKLAEHLQSRDRCEQCGAAIPPAANFCPGCAEPQSPARRGALNRDV